LRLANERVVVNEDRRCEGSACKDWEEHQASDSRRHLVHSLEDNGVSLEEHVEYTIDEQQVCGGRGNDRLETKHAKRACERHCGHLFEAFLLKFDAGKYLIVSGRFFSVLRHGKPRV
jgi:hypothetical protein